MIFLFYALRIFTYRVIYFWKVMFHRPWPHRLIFWNSSGAGVARTPLQGPVVHKSCWSACCLYLPAAILSLKICTPTGCIGLSCSVAIYLAWIIMVMYNSTVLLLVSLRLSSTLPVSIGILRLAFGNRWHSRIPNSQGAAVWFSQSRCSNTLLIINQCC